MLNIKRILLLLMLLMTQINFAQNTFPITGNVGIGTATPDAKLNVVGNINIDNIDWATDNELRIREGGSNSYGAFFKYGLNDLLAIGTRNADLDFTAIQISRGSLNTVFNGNVGIGVVNPINKLAVNGTIHCKEVKVDMTGWPDFVFKKEYNLPTLEQVEKHIAEKGHLENIPSEEEVLKNGINLGEINAKLLQKIEELTLYMIEMKKENENIKKENAEMKKDISMLKTKRN
jgi:hypothetical protein